MVSDRPAHWCFLTIGVGLVASLFLAGVSAAELSVAPREVLLPDAFARRQMLVELDGRDATRSAVYASKNAVIATVDSAGYVTPVAEGTTEIIVAYEGRQAVVPVK